MESHAEHEISLRRLATLEEMDSAVELQAQIWGYGRDDRDHPYPSRALFALSESGGLVSGAFCDEKLAGFAVAWLGRFQSSGAYYLHSQLLGVLPEYRRLGIGLRLKLHQRDFALESDLALIRWTFDPLQAINGRFNLRTLGALAQTYSENHYGAIRSHLSGGQPSDRLWADWFISSPRVVKRLSNRVESRFRDLPQVLQAQPVGSDFEGFFTPAVGPLPAEHSEVLVQIPTDLDRMLRCAPELASRWRFATRDVFSCCLREGYVVDDCFYSSTGNNSSAFYHLTQRDLDQFR